MSSSLSSRIIEALEGGEASPHGIAARLFPSLSQEEVLSLALDALVERVRNQISLDRAQVSRQAVATPTNETLVLTSRGYAWPPDDELREMLGDGSFSALADRLGVSTQTLKKRCHRRGIEDSWDRADREAEKEFRAKMSKIVQDFADEAKAEGIKIGLEQANTERVCVAGEWMFLGDCDVTHLRTLADEYAQRAGANLERGAYYSVLADRLAAGSHATVRAMCEAEVLVAA